MLIMQGHRDSLGSKQIFRAVNQGKITAGAQDQEVVGEQEADGIHLHPDWWFEEILFAHINRSFSQELRFFHSHLLNVCFTHSFNHSFNNYFSSFSYVRTVH